MNLNLHSAVCQLHPNKTEKKLLGKKVYTFRLLPCKFLQAFSALKIVQGIYNF